MEADGARVTGGGGGAATAVVLAEGMVCLRSILVDTPLTVDSGFAGVRSPNAAARARNASADGGAEVVAPALSGGTQPGGGGGSAICF